MKSTQAWSRATLANCGLLAACLTILSVAPAMAQDHLSNVERALLLRMSTDRWSDRDFQRQLYGLQSARNADRFRGLSNLQRQGAAQRAMADRARIQAALNTGHTSRAKMDPRAQRLQQQQQEEDEIDSDLLADVMLVFQNFGVVFKAADPSVIRKVAPKFENGLEVAKIRAGGPVENAGWKVGDILLGLDKYQVQSYSDVGYVADMKDLAQINPIKTILIRDSKLVNGTLDITTAQPLDFGPPPEDDKGDANNPNAKQITKPAPRGDNKAPAKNEDLKGTDDFQKKSTDDFSKQIVPSVPKNSTAEDGPGPVSNPKTDRTPRLTSEKISELPPLARKTPTRNIEQPPLMDGGSANKSGKKERNGNDGVVQSGIKMSDDEALWSRIGIAGESADGLFGDGKFKGGVRITQVRPASPARHENFRMGDVIVSLYEYQMTQPSDVAFALNEADAASKKQLEYTVVREGRTIKGKIEAMSAAEADPPADGFQRLPKEK